MASLEHWATMARILRPTGVANWVARKARRLWQIERYKRHPQTTPQSLLDFWGCEKKQAVSTAFFGLSDEAFCSRRQLVSVKSAVNSCPGVMEGALVLADEALKRRFDIFECAVDFGGQETIDWALEPVSNFRYPLIPSSNIPLSQPGLDPKYPWALGRLDSLIHLAQGYVLSDDEAKRLAYSQEWERQLSDFLKANPEGVGIQWACPMEVSLRAINIAISLRMLGQEVLWGRTDFVLEVFAALTTHCEFVRSHLEDEVGVPNNHLLANALGLFVVGLLFPRLPNSPYWIAQGQRLLGQQMQRQVFEDGVSFEGSVPYHRLSLEMLTLAYVLSKSEGVLLDSQFAKRLHRMYGAVEAWTSENGWAPQVGDNDSGRVLAFSRRHSLQQGYLLGLGAALFNDASLKRFNSEYPIEACWLLGEVGIIKWGKLIPGETRNSFISKPAGIFVLKGAGATLTVCAGTVGQNGVGGHSHHHQLSFELHHRGLPLVVDSGSPTYTRNRLQRNSFRSTSAHNVVEVDGREQGPLNEASLFALPEGARGQLLSFREEKEAVSLSVGLERFAAEGEPVMWTREFRVLRELEVLSIVDVLEGHKKHRLVSRLHLPNEVCRLRPPEEAEVIRARNAGFSGPFNDLVLELELSSTVVLFSSQWRVAVKPSLYSPGYGQLNAASCVELNVETFLPFQATMMFLLGRSGRSQSSRAKPSERDKPTKIVQKHRT